MSADADRLVSQGDPLLVTYFTLQRLSPVAALAAYSLGSGPLVVGGLAILAALLGIAQSVRGSGLARIVFAVDLDRTMTAIGRRSPARVRGGSHDELLGAVWRAINARQLLVRNSEPSMWASAIALPIAGLLVALNGLALAGAVLGAFLVGLVVRVPLARRHREAVSQTWVLYGEVISDLGHALRGLDDLQAHGLTETVRRRLRGHAATLARAESAAAKLGAWATWLPLSAGVVVLALYVSLRGGAWSHVWLEAAWLAALGPIAVTLARALVDRAKQRADARILDALCDLPPDLPSTDPTTAPKSLSPIELDAVSFRYPTSIDADSLAPSSAPKATSDAPNATILDDVTIRWGAARPLAIVGANGSGKSTVIALMLRLVDPTEGVVRVGGVDLKSIDGDSFRSKIGYVPQRPLVLEGMTVREAVQLVAPDATDAAILDALDVVGLRARLRSRGGDPLSIKSSALSVGEAQRVALARALVRDPKLVVLDEPEAALDPESREAIHALLDRLASEGKKLVVATQHEEVLPTGASVLRLPLDRGSLVTLE